MAGSVLPQEEKLDVSLLGVSSFGGKRLAEVSSSEFGSMAVEAGTTLPNGARVSSITDRSVVIVHRGKRSTIYLSGGSSGTSTSSAKPLEKTFLVDLRQCPADVIEKVLSDIELYHFIHQINIDPAVFLST